MAEIPAEYLRDIRQEIILRLLADDPALIKWLKGILGVYT